MKKSTVFLLILILIYGTLVGLSKELPDDVNKLTKMAQKGNVEAQLKLANIYYEGIGIEPNYDEAKYYYELAANKNAPLGFVGLGNCYLNGLGVSEDAAEAASMFKKAADMGSIEGKAELGYCYYFGYGVEKNVDESLKLCSEAAAKGNAEGMYILGRAYYYGNGVEENDDEAFKYLYKAASEGFLEAYPLLAECYSEGWGVEKNDDIAFKLLSYAYEQGDPQVIVPLSNCYMDGLGTQKDPEMGFQLLLEAEKNGKNVNYSLGKCYLKGIGVEKNFEKAVEYFNKANSSSGFKTVAEAYLNGDGVEKNFEKAIEYFNKANSSYGFKTVAEAYLKGDGVEKNYNEAVKYYQLAADRASMDSAYDLREIGNWYYNGYLGPINYEEAVKYYRKAIEVDSEYALALEDLARCYIFGQGVPQSYEEAEKIYKKLAAQGEDVKEELYMCKIKGNYYKGLLKLYQQPMDAFTTMILDDNNATFYMMNDDLELPYTMKKNGNTEVLDFKMREGLNHTLTSKDHGLSWVGTIGAAEGKYKWDFWLLKWPYTFFFCHMLPEYLKPIICDPDGYNVIIVFDDPRSGTLAAMAEAYFKEDGNFYIKYDNPLMKNHFQSIQGTFSIEDSRIILKADQGTTLVGYIQDNGDFISINMGQISGNSSNLYIIR